MVEPDLRSMRICGFVGALGPVGASEGFEAVPDDAFGLPVVGADVPDEAVGTVSHAHDLEKSEMGLTEAATGDEDAEAGCA